MPIPAVEAGAMGANKACLAPSGRPITVYGWFANGNPPVSIPNRFPTDHLESNELTTLAAFAAKALLSLMALAMASGICRFMTDAKPVLSNDRTVATVRMLTLLTLASLCAVFLFGQAPRSGCSWVAVALTYSFVALSATTREWLAEVLSLLDRDRRTGAVERPDPCSPS